MLQGHLGAVGHLPQPWARNSPLSHALVAALGSGDGSALNQLPRLSSRTENALGTPSPCGQRPLERTGQWRDARGASMGMKRWKSVPSPEGSDGQKHQHKGHSQESPGEMEVDFRGFSGAF